MGRALVLGCGGTLGFAWAATVLAEIGRQVWDPRSADVVVGTSAGAELAAMLGAGVPASAIHAALTDDDGADARVRDHVHSPAAPGRLPGLPRPSLPALGLTLSAVRRRTDLLAGLAGLLPRGSGDATWLRDLGDALTATTATTRAGAATGGAWVDHPATWLVAADTLTGERVALGSAEAPRTSLGTAIAASWAIPGWFPPVRIGGRSFVDGGAISPTSADLLLPLVRAGAIDEVVIVAPMSSHGGATAHGLDRAERLLRRPMTRRVDREEHDLRQAGATVRRLEPTTEDLAAMGPNFMDPRRRDQVLAIAARTAPALVSRHLTPEVSR